MYSHELYREAAMAKRLSDEQLAKELERLFSQPGIAGVGAKRLLEKLRARGFSAGLARVQKWMASNETAGPAVAAPAPNTYQRQRVYDVIKPNAVHELDVLFLPRDPDGSRYALTFVDLASRFKWAYPMADKESGTVAKAIKAVYESKRVPLTWPKEVKVDAGKEFEGQVTTLLQGHGVKIRRAKKADHRAQSMIESFNGQLAKRIFGEQRSEEGRTGIIKRAWVATLPAILKEINSEKNALTKLALQRR